MKKVFIISGLETDDCVFHVLLVLAGNSAHFGIFCAFG